MNCCLTVESDICSYSFDILAYCFSEGFIALSSLVSKLVSEQLEVGDMTSTTEEYITTLNANGPLSYS